MILRSRRPSSAEEASASSRAVAACCACSCASATRASWELPGAINSKNSGAATSVFRSSVPVLHRAPIRALSTNFPGRAEPPAAMSASPTRSPTSAFGCSTGGAADRMQRKRTTHTTEKRDVAARARHANVQRRAPALHRWRVRLFAARWRRWRRMTMRSSSTTSTLLLSRHHLRPVLRLAPCRLPLPHPARPSAPRLALRREIALLHLATRRIPDGMVCQSFSLSLT